MATDLPIHFSITPFKMSSARKEVLSDVKFEQLEENILTEMRLKTSKEKLEFLFAARFSPIAKLAISQCIPTAPFILAPSLQNYTGTPLCTTLYTVLATFHQRTIVGCSIIAPVHCSGGCTLFHLAAVKTNLPSTGYLVAPKLSAHPPCKRQIWPQNGSSANLT